MSKHDSGLFVRGALDVVVPTELTVNQIRQVLNGGNVVNEFLESCQNDPRQGVRDLVSSYLRVLKKREVEESRLEKLYNFEVELWNQGYTKLAGIDEAGRGPLAGPVVAGAVIFPGISKIPGLNDSKQVPEAKRVELAREIRNQALAWSIGIASVREIDELNILGATKLAMSRAVDGLGINPGYLLIDAVRLNQSDIPCKPIIGGDALSASIAAASILAKVYRDNLMERLHRDYPYYNFASNKGYLTAEHAQALELYGPCPAHRTSFAPVRTVKTTKSTV